MKLDNRGLESNGPKTSSMEVIYVKVDVLNNLEDEKCAF
jgi:hypothetical protein